MMTDNEIFRFKNIYRIVKGFCNKNELICNYTVSKYSAYGVIFVSKNYYKREYYIYCDEIDDEESAAKDIIDDIRDRYRIKDGSKKGESSMTNKKNTTENKYVPDIRNVVFNYPATIVFWEDGTKTVVKCQPDDDYSMETGLALCIAKKALGNKGNFNDIFKKWIDYDTRNYYDNLFSIFSNLVGTESNKQK